MYLDTDVLYALIKEKDFNKEYAEKAVAEKGPKYTSTITLVELEIVIKRELGDGLSLSTAALVEKAVPKIRLLDFTARQFEKSLLLREKHGLGIFDAFHAAVCLDKKLEMAPTDAAYGRVPGIRRVK